MSFSKDKHAYFDYLAASPPFPEALDVFVDVSQRVFGNPSSPHDIGNLAKTRMKQAKDAFAQLCNLHGGCMILTSGATEANNLAIRGVMDQFPRGRLLLAADVHASAWFAKETYGHRVDILPVDSEGRISTAGLVERISSDTALCSVVHGNNETGIIHDVSSIGRICADKGILLHCDGAQVIGRLPLNLDDLACDFYTFSAHKFGGTRGAGGILSRKKKTDLLPHAQGGGQEDGLRAGTENVAGLASAVRALELCTARMAGEVDRLRALTSLLTEKLKRGKPRNVIYSDHETGLPGLVSVSFPGTNGMSVVADMNMAGFALSTGSACSAHEAEPSRVIRAMGRSREEALGTIRISMGRSTSEEEVLALAETLLTVIERQLRLK